MNRFQKKCLVASALMHGLLLLVLVVGTAFFNVTPKPVESHIIEIVGEPVVTDAKTHGGSPAAATAVSVPEVKPLVEPKPVPAEPVKERAPEPEPPKKVEETKPKEEPKKEVVSEIPISKKSTKKVLPEPVSIPKTTTKPAPAKHLVDISKPTIRNNKEKQAAADAAERAAEKRAQAQRLAAVNGSLKNLGKNLSTSTTIEMPGSGGGQAEVNYGDFVLAKYDAAWIAPAEVDDNEAIVKARVVIARNGNVVSAEIIKASRNATLDKSVRRALELKFIQPFPEGSTDSQRTFIINFNLKSKRGIG